MTVAEIKPNVQTKYGPKNLVKIIHTGQEFDWFQSPAFTIKNFQGVREGADIDVSQIPFGEGKSTYNVTVVSQGSGDSTAAKVATASINPVLTDRAKDAEVLQNRISIAGYLQALIHSGKDIEASKALALDLVRWSKQQALALYEEDHEPGLPDLS